MVKTPEMDSNLTGKFSTVNLSDKNLSKTCLELLEKGLTFTPTPRFIPIRSLINEKNQLLRQIKLKSYFHDSKKPPPTKTKFSKPSGWAPPYQLLDYDTQKTLDHVNLNFSNQIDKLLKKNLSKIPNYEKDNLTTSERIELKNLMNDDQIIIKPADKGGATVILDKHNYILEALRQLSDPKYYIQLEQPIYHENVSKINEILKEMKNLGFISEKEFDFLSPAQYKERTFYLLPKIHKPPQKWTIPNKMPQGRPIVSDVGSETYNISQYIDSFLNPLAQNHPSYIKNTYDFLDKIKLAQNTFKDRDFLLVTGDITSLYTNMDLNRSISEVKKIFAKNPNINRSDGHIISLLEICLKHNDFFFDNKYFLQIMGTAMGKRFAPALANIYLLEFDRAAMNDFKIKPELFFRFLDDVFFIWLGSEKELKDFENFLNTLIPDIHIEFEYSKTSINFLDTTIFTEKGQLKHTVYCKPTDTHQLLHRNSYHPPHTFNGILKSQLIRYKRICCDFNRYLDTCKILFKSLKNRGYNFHRMKTLAKQIWNENQNKPKTSNKKEIFPLIGDYHGINKKILDQNKNILQKNPKFANHSILKAFRANPNLKQILTRSRFPPKNN